MNYLFVCKHNFTRSKYCAEFFRGFLKEKKNPSNVYSAGISFSSLILGRRINKKRLKRMDLIFVMEKYMKDYLIKYFDVKNEKIIVLNIPDNYGFLRLKNIDDLDKRLERFLWEKYL